MIKKGERTRKKKKTLPSFLHITDELCPSLHSPSLKIIGEAFQTMPTRFRKIKAACFLSCVEDRSKDKHTQKQARSYTKSEVENVCNSGTTLWNSGKEGREKRTIEHQQYQNT
jgi:hypothetical protein